MFRHGTRFTGEVSHARATEPNVLPGRAAAEADRERAGAAGHLSHLHRRLALVVGQRIAHDAGDEQRTPRRIGDPGDALSRATLVVDVAALLLAGSLPRALAVRAIPLAGLVLPDDVSGHTHPERRQRSAAQGHGERWQQRLVAAFQTRSSGYDG